MQFRWHINLRPVDRIKKLSEANPALMWIWCIRKMSFSINHKNPPPETRKTKSADDVVEKNFTLEINAQPRMLFVPNVIRRAISKLFAYPRY